MSDTEIKPLTDDEAVAAFSEISNERQWGWGEELECALDLISAKGLWPELAALARTVADEEHAEDIREGRGDRRVLS